METKPAAKIKNPRNVRKILLITLLTVFIILNAIFFAAGNYFYNIIINWPVTNSYAIGSLRLFAAFGFHKQFCNV